MALFGPRFGSMPFGGQMQPQSGIPGDPMVPPQIQRLIEAFSKREIGGPRTSDDFQEMARAGTAPATFGNIMGALGNVGKVISGPITAGFATAANQLTGLGDLRKEDTFMGKVVDALAPSGLQSVGATPLDQDLVAGISDRNSLGRARSEQDRRNEARAGADREKRAERGRAARGV